MNAENSLNTGFDGYGIVLFHISRLFIVTGSLQSSLSIGKRFSRDSNYGKGVFFLDTILYACASL